MFPRPPDSPTGPHDTNPAHPVTFPGYPDTFPGYIGSISFDGNSDDLAILLLDCLIDFGYFRQNVTKQWRAVRNRLVPKPFSLHIA